MEVKLKSASVTLKEFEEQSTILRCWQDRNDDGMVPVN